MKKRADFEEDEYDKRIDRWYKVEMSIAKVIFISCATIFFLRIACAAWIYVDRLSWVRFVLALPCPGWLKMWLWRW